MQFLVALIVLAISRPPLEAQVVLRWKFQAGEQIRYTRDREQVTSKTSDGIKTLESIHATTDMTLLVREAAAEERPAQLVLTIDRIQYQRKSAGGDWEYDSKANPLPVGTEARF